MVPEVSQLELLLSQIAVTIPIVTVLIVGMVICYRQRRRRPRVSKLIGWALFAELIWIVVGSPLMLLVFSSLEEAHYFEEGGGGAVSWMMRTILYSLPGSTVTAAVWGTVLWAVLQVDDMGEESVSH